MIRPRSRFMPQAWAEGGGALDEAEASPTYERLQDQVDERALDEIKFLEVSTAMVTYGVPFPVVPESPEIMNIIVPEMIQNALTDKMTVAEAADDDARRVEDLMSGI
jgi:maltose-binding protein MalE